MTWRSAVTPHPLGPRQRSAPRRVPDGTGVAEPRGHRTRTGLQPPSDARSAPPGQPLPAPYMARTERPSPRAASRNAGPPRSESPRTAAQSFRPRPARTHRQRLMPTLEEPANQGSRM